MVQRNAQRVDFEKMLKNASILAIVGLDTAENGPSKVRQVTNRIDAIIELKYRSHRRTGRRSTRQRASPIPGGHVGEHHESASRVRARKKCGCYGVRAKRRRTKYVCDEENNQ